jgi:hypothetical protein
VYQGLAGRCGLLLHAALRRSEPVAWKLENSWRHSGEQHPSGCSPHTRCCCCLFLCINTGTCPDEYVPAHCCGRTCWCKHRAAATCCCSGTQRSTGRGEGGRHLAARGTAVQAVHDARGCTWLGAASAPPLQQPTVLQLPLLCYTRSALLAASMCHCSWKALSKAHVIKPSVGQQEQEVRRTTRATGKMQPCMKQHAAA